MDKLLKNKIVTIVIFVLSVIGEFSFSVCNWNEFPKEYLIRELTKPLRLNSLNSNSPPDLSNVKLEYDFKVYDTVVNDENLGRLLLSYVIVDDVEFCGFKYKYNMISFPMLVKRKELIGSLTCRLNKQIKDEFPVYSYCFGEIQMAYPFNPSNIVSLRKNDVFLIQNCIIKFPNYRGIAYKYPKIPNNQLNVFNSTIFETQLVTLNANNSSNSTGLEDKKNGDTQGLNNKAISFDSFIDENSTIIKYQLKKEFYTSECIISRLYSGKTFEVIAFSIVGTITCQIRKVQKGGQTRSSIQRTLNRDVIRSLCTGIAEFDQNSSDHNFGILQFNHNKPFLSIKCASIPLEIFNFKILNPDQAIKNVIFSIKNEEYINDNDNEESEEDDY